MEETNINTEEILTDPLVNIDLIDVLAKTRQKLPIFTLVPKYHSYDEVNRKVNLTTVLEEVVDVTTMSLGYVYSNNKLGLFNFSNISEDIGEIGRVNSFSTWASKFKEKISNNEVLDTDTLIFSKSSKFPRTSFNRYSDKARLVQNPNNATKVVISDEFFNTINGTSANFMLITDENDKELCFFNFDPRKIFQKIAHDRPGDIYIEHITFENESLKAFAMANNFNATWRYPDKEEHLVNIYLKALAEKFELPKVETASADISGLVFNTKQDMNSFKDYFLSGKFKTDQFVFDNKVNKYIDQFKGDLDESTLSYLYDTLKSGADPEVPMQLLTNLSLPDECPKLDSLFLKLEGKIVSGILNHRVSNSIDVKNFVTRFDLKRFDKYDKKTLSNYLMMLGSIWNGYKKHQSKLELFNLIKDDLNEVLNTQYTRKGSKLKINLTLEEDEGIDI